MERGQRVRLKADFTSDECGLTFKAGQIGTTGSMFSDALVVVEFDGYEDARRRDQELLARLGEGFNIVPWLAPVPVDLLELAPPDER